MIHTAVQLTSPYDTSLVG